MIVAQMIAAQMIVAQMIAAQMIAAGEGELILGDFDNDADAEL